MKASPFLQPYGLRELIRVCRRGRHLPDGRLQDPEPLEAHRRLQHGPHALRGTPLHAQEDQEVSFKWYKDTNTMLLDIGVFWHKGLTSYNASFIQALFSCQGTSLNKLIGHPCPVDELKLHVSYVILYVLATASVCSC